MAVLVTLFIVVTGCGASDEDHTFDELFDEAIALYCTDAPTDACRDAARTELDLVTSASEYSREDILAHMVDELDPDQFDSFGDAVWEAARQLILQ